MIIPSFIGWRIKRTLKKRPSFKGTNSALSLCFICNVNEKDALTALPSYINSLKKRGKKVSLIAFYNGNRKSFEKEFPEALPGIIVTRSDFNLFAGIKNNEVMDALEKSVDILCNFDTSYTPITHMIASQSKAKFKVGTDLSETEIYDLVLDRKKDPTVIKYLQDFKEVMGNIFSNELSHS